MTWHGVYVRLACPWLDLFLPALPNTNYTFERMRCIPGHNVSTWVYPEECFPAGLWSFPAYVVPHQRSVLGALLPHQITHFLGIPIVVLPKA
jgi:hypothetical protein